MSDQPLNQPTRPEAPKPAPAAGSPDQNRLLAALAYFGILFIVPLLIAKNDDFVKFHVRQGIIWFVVWLFASFIVWIPLLGWSVGLALIAVSAYASYQAYEGRRWELPYLGKHAQQIKL